MKINKEDYHNDPLLILNLNENLLNLIWKEFVYRGGVRNKTIPRSTYIGPWDDVNRLKFQMAWLIKHFKEEMLTAADKVLYE